MPQTQTDDSGASAFPQELPALPKDGTELYDSIMKIVEPELVSAELPKVRERLKAENPVEVKAHAKRYMRAFTKFNALLQQSEHVMHHSIQQFTQNAYASLEQVSDSCDADRMTQIEKDLKESKVVKQKAPEELLENETPEPNIA